MLEGFSEEGMMIERRKHPRAPKTIPLKISDAEFDIITETKNISSSGAYCQIDQSLPLMSKVEILLLIPSRSELKTPAKKIKCKGVVVRVEPTISNNLSKAHYNIAIFFTDISERDRSIIERCVNAVREQAPEIKISTSEAAS